MTNEEFWFAEPRLAEAYRQAQDIKNEIVNQQLWLQGLYNLDAFSVTVANAFGKQNAKKQKYMEQPIELKPKKQTPEEARQKVVDQLNAWKESWDKRGELNGNRDR